MGLCEVCGQGHLQVVVLSGCVPGTYNGLCRCCWEAGTEPVGRLESHLSSFRESGDVESLGKGRALRKRTLRHLAEAHGRFVSLSPPKGD